MIFDEKVFRERQHADEQRSGDHRDEYERDKARIIHSAAFRRLQGKTQVMGVGEGDFHRTRLTHSIEAGQIGEGLLLTLRGRCKDSLVTSWLPSAPLIVASCYAHDLGHPPFGHGGERALQQKMHGKKGFEGNAQTLRILTKLEKYRRHQGINPTRRTILAVLKYPVSYGSYDESNYRDHPPKCYYDEEGVVIHWALKPFSEGDKRMLAERGANDKPKYRTLDASIMECADDIAYAIHDLEDIVARDLVSRDDVEQKFSGAFSLGKKIGPTDKGISPSDLLVELFDNGSEARKRVIGRLVNLFITEIEIQRIDRFEHPLFANTVGWSPELKELLKKLKQITFDLVVERAAVQQLERRGQRIIGSLYSELLADPKALIPTSAWDSLDTSDTVERRISDYVAGMTDPYAERIYHRLFTPGFGSSRDEL